MKLSKLIILIKKYWLFNLIDIIRLWIYQVNAYDVIDHLIGMKS